MNHPAIKFEGSINGFEVDLATMPEAEKSPEAQIAEGPVVER